MEKLSSLWYLYLNYNNELSSSVKNKLRGRSPQVKCCVLYCESFQS